MAKHAMSALRRDPQIGSGDAHGSHSVVTTARPAMQARERKAFCVEMADETVGARRRPRLGDAELANAAALQRDEPRIDRREVWTNPEVGVDRPHHLFL